MIRLAAGAYRLGRGEIEELGVRVGLERREVAREFLALSGDAWVGELVAARRPPYWVDTPPTGEEVPEWVEVNLVDMQ